MGGGEGTQGGKEGGGHTAAKQSSQIKYKLKIYRKRSANITTKDPQVLRKYITRIKNNRRKKIIIKSLNRKTVNNKSLNRRRG